MPQFSLKIGKVFQKHKFPVVYTHCKLWMRLTSNLTFANVVKDLLVLSGFQAVSLGKESWLWDSSDARRQTLLGPLYVFT
jgi:hypothetical protein